MKRLFLLIAITVLAMAGTAQAQVTFAGGVTGSVTVNCVPKATVANTIATTVICDDGTTTSVATNKFTVTNASGNTSVAGTLGVTGNVAVNTNKFTIAASSGNTVVAGTLGVTSDVAVATNKFTITAASGNTAIAGTLAVASGVSTLGGGLVTGSTIDTGTGATLTTASSGFLLIASAATDAETVFILPAATTKARYCGVIDSVAGSSRALKFQTPTGSDLIIGTTNPAGATGIASTAGASHGIVNTHASAVRGNAVCLQADGTNTWYMTSLSGTWASY